MPYPIEREIAATQAALNALQARLADQPWVGSRAKMTQGRSDLIRHLQNLVFREGGREVPQVGELCQAWVPIRHWSDDSWIMDAAGLMLCPNEGTVFSPLHFYPRLCRKHAMELREILIDKLRDDRDWQSCAIHILKETGAVSSALFDLDALAVRLQEHGYEVHPPESDESPEPRNRPTVCYFIQLLGVTQNIIKIGSCYEDRLKTRIRNIENGDALPHGVEAPVAVNLVACLPGGQPVETAMHKRFAEYRLDYKREWFYFGPKIQDYLAGLVTDRAALAPEVR
jgi:hypothetical protein